MLFLRKSYFNKLVYVALTSISMFMIMPYSPVLGQTIETREVQPPGDQVGRVNPNQPIKIEIANGSNKSVQFILTEPVSTLRRLSPNGQISFGTTHTNYLAPPTYLLAYPNEQEIGINLYVISTENNIVKVVVSEQRSQIPGNRNLSIEADGGVYVF